MQNAWIWIVTIVVIVVGGFLWWQSSQTPSSPADLEPTDTTTVTPSPAPAATSTDDTSTTSSGTDTGTSAGMSATVTYTSSGFSPATVTIKKGGTVTWTEQGVPNMWVASSPHPAHTGYDNTSRSAHCAPGYTGAKSFDQCAPGTTYSFTFDKVGTWPYHDHMNASNFGKVIVVE